MTETEKKKWLRMVGGTIEHPAMGEFIVTGVNCNSLFVKRQGEESIYKMNISSIKVKELPGGKDYEKSFLKVLETESGITFSKIREDTKFRGRDAVEFRQIHMTFRHKCMRLSLALSAEPYGKDHATALHAVKTVRNFATTDKIFIRKYTETINFIKEINADAFEE